MIHDEKERGMNGMKSDTIVCLHDLSPRNRSPSHRKRAKCQD